MPLGFVELIFAEVQRLLLGGALTAWPSDVSSDGGTPQDGLPCCDGRDQDV